MRAATTAHLPVPRADWFEWLCHELAPFPGRKEMTIRLVVAVVVVTVISMTLQVPEVAISAYMVFFVTKENRMVTALTGVLLIVGATIAIAASLVLIHWTLEYPALRLIVMAVVLFTGMYLSRVFVVGPLGFAIGFVMSAAQSFLDGVPNGESAVRALLWLWVLVVYPLALTVVLNQFLLPAHPYSALQRAIEGRLDAVIAALRRIIGASHPDEKAGVALRDLATRGSAPLLKLLHFAEIRNARLAADHARQSAIITASERLAVAAAALEMRGANGFAEADMAYAAGLIHELVEFRGTISGKRNLPALNKPDGSQATSLEVRELQQATKTLRDTLEGSAVTKPTPTPAKAKKHLFVADAFTNPAHAHFALKVTLAAMACYVFYIGVNWSGIHTAFITCCFIALESTGASLRKGWLRLAGCCIGGLLGFVSILYLIPRMETIASLILLTGAVSALAGWIAAGSERIAYAGLQIALASYLAIFQGFAPATDLDVIRDRLAGIVLGIVAVSVVFRYLWPERVIDRLRASLATCFRKLADLIGNPHPGQASESFAEEAAHLRGDIAGCIEASLHLTELAMFEDADVDRSQYPIALVEGLQNLYFTGATLTSNAAYVDWRFLSDTTQHEDYELRQREAKRLERMAACLQGNLSNDADESPQPSPGPDSSLESPVSDRADLLRLLTTQTDRLEEQKG